MYREDFILSVHLETVERHVYFSGQPDRPGQEVPRIDQGLSIVEGEQKSSLALEHPPDLLEEGSDVVNIATGPQVHDDARDRSVRKRQFLLEIHLLQRKVPHVT